MTKFLFDNSFEVDSEGNLKPDEKPDVLYTEEDLAAARGEAQQIGYSAGRQEALGEIQNLAANTLQNIAAAVDNIGMQHEQAILAAKQDAARMAMVIAGKLAPALLQCQPLDEVKGLITDCLDMVSDEPRIVVRVSDALIDILAEDVDQLAARGGFQGTVVLLGEANLSGADCRVEWADGGAERDIEALLQKVDAAVGRYCAYLTDQIGQIEARIQAGEQIGGPQDQDADAAEQDQLVEMPVITAPTDDDDPFPLPPGAEDFGVVEDPLPPVARAASQVPPIPDNGEPQMPPATVTEP